MMLKNIIIFLILLILKSCKTPQAFVETDVNTNTKKDRIKCECKNTCVVEGVRKPYVRCKDE